MAASRGGALRFRGGAPPVRQPILEPVAVAPDGDHLGMMEEPVEDGGRHHLVADNNYGTPSPNALEAKYPNPGNASPL